jgi:hypothetical protein
VLSRCATALRPAVFICTQYTSSSVRYPVGEVCKSPVPLNRCSRAHDEVPLYTKSGTTYRLVAMISTLFTSYAVCGRGSRDHINEV